MVISTVVQGHTFTIAEKYRPKSILGRGSFGVVCTAYDSENDKTIAIKRIRPFANDEWDAKHTLREIRLLKLFKDHPNVISLYSLSLFEEKSELYMMMELMDCDLHRVIQSKQELTEAHIKCFAKQLLEGINALHSVGVFHRDIKPGNILVSKDCQLRITDFGLARFMDEKTLNGNNSRNPMTEYVVTRWYRCPELLLAPNQPYSAAVDIWSIGCILGELIKRKPIFPGKSHTHQVQLVLEVRGYSSPADLGFKISEESKTFLSRRCIFPGQSLNNFISGASKESMELIEAFLQVNPNSRPSASEALSYSFFNDAQVLTDYKNIKIEPPNKSLFNFEYENYSLAKLKEMIHDEVKSYIPETFVIEGTVIEEENPVISSTKNKKIESEFLKNVGMNKDFVNIDQKYKSNTNSLVDDSSLPITEDLETVNRNRSKVSELMNRKSFVMNSNQNQTNFNPHYTANYQEDTGSSEFDHKFVANYPEKIETSQSRRVIKNDKSEILYPKITPQFKNEIDASHKKLEAILEKDRKIKRRFFLQSLFSKPQQNIEDETDRFSSKPISNNKALPTKGLKDILNEKIPTSATDRMLKSGIISALRGSLGNNGKTIKNYDNIVPNHRGDFSCIETSQKKEIENWQKTSQKNVIVGDNRDDNIFGDVKLNSTLQMSSQPKSYFSRSNPTNDHPTRSFLGRFEGIKTNKIDGRP